MMRTQSLIVMVTLLAVSRAPLVAGDVFTVGEHGSYGMFPQDAVLAAIDLAGGDHEIRIESGSYADVLSISTVNGGSLSISGGWNGSFTARSDDPSLTVLSGNGASQVLTVSPGVAAGLVLVEGLSFSNAAGTAAAVSPTGNGVLVFRNSRFVDSALTVTAPVEASGAGLKAVLFDTSYLLVSGCEFSGNSVSSSASQSYGAGLAIWAEDDASFDVVHSLFADNSLQSPAASPANGAGLMVMIRDTADGTVDACLAVGNTVLAGSEARGEGVYLGFNPFVTTTGSITARRLQVWDNSVGTVPGAAAQLWIEAAFDGVAHIADSVVAGGDQDGVRAMASGNGTLRLTNLTVADHAAYGIAFEANDGDHSSIHNTVLWSNGSDFLAIGSGTGSAAFILSGADPNFRDPAARDYRIEAPSPAIDSGTGAPPAGLGEVDAAGCPRVAGSAPDIGAYELGSIFGDGFESGDGAAWSGVVH